MAKQLHQNPDARRQFLRSVDQAEQQRRMENIGRIKRDHPIVGPLVAPLVKVIMADDDWDRRHKGHVGEKGVAKTLSKLPSPWLFLNDFVLERQPGGYMQIDHIVIGPACVAVIETKNWRGAIFGDRDIWRVKLNDRWDLRDSPTNQAAWHAREVQQYLAAHGHRVNVLPIVVFHAPDWLRHQKCRCLVFASTSAMRHHLVSVKEDPAFGLVDWLAVGEILAAATDFSSPRAARGPRLMGADPRKPSTPES